MTVMYNKKSNTFDDSFFNSDYKKELYNIVNKYRNNIIIYLSSTMKMNNTKEISDQPSQDIKYIISNIVKIILNCKNEINDFMDKNKIIFNLIDKDLPNMNKSDLIDFNKLLDKYINKVHYYAYRVHCLDESIMKAQNMLYR